MQLYKFINQRSHFINHRSTVRDNRDHLVKCKHFRGRSIVNECSVPLWGLDIWDSFSICKMETANQRVAVRIKEVSTWKALSSVHGKHLAHTAVTGNKSQAMTRLPECRLRLPPKRCTILLYIPTWNQLCQKTSSSLLISLSTSSCFPHYWEVIASLMTQQ